MAIRGSLKEASLPDVLQLLAMGKKSGCLSVTHRNNFGSIFFDSGKICYASIVNRRDRLGDILVKSGLLTQAHLDEAVGMQAKARGQRLGELLVEKQMITRENLHAQIRIQIEEAVYFLFTWAEGTFNFESDIRPEEQDFLVSINPESLLLEGARRVDEWSLIEKKVPSFDLVFELDRRRLVESDAHLTSEQKALVPLIDGRRDVAAIVDESGLVEFEVGKALYGLATAGFLHRVGKSKPQEANTADVRVEEHRNLGLAFYKTGMLDEALREFRRVVELRPDDLGARFHLGLSHLRLGKWSDALSDFETASRQRGAKAAVFLNLALAQERLGRLDDAQASLQEALIRGGEGEPRVHLSLGILHIRQGLFADADSRLRHARPLYGDKAPAAVWFHWAGLAAALAGHLPKAIEVLREGVKAHPHAAALHNNLAVALALDGQGDDALHAIDHGITADPGMAQLHRNRGDLLLEAGRHEQALDEYRRAVKQHETLGPEVWARIGSLLSSQGDILEAERAWERALVLDPSHREARHRLSASRGDR